MYARSTAALGMLAAVAFVLPTASAPTYTLRSSGAINVGAAGGEARYGVVPQALRGGPILLVSLGDAGSPGALQLTLAGDSAPAPGRYPIRAAWDNAADSAAFHAAFLPGTAERPLGWFHGESGTVTITRTGSGRLAGTFEVRARGFAAADPDTEQWVTVRGAFDAAGDSTAARIAAR